MRIVDILVNAQRVNHDWLATVKRSKIQQALFLELVPLPLFEFPGAELSPDLATMDCVAALSQAPNSAVIKNPFIDRITTPSIRYRTDLKALFRFTALDASWRRMFISQPPTQFNCVGKRVLKIGDASLDFSMHIFFDHYEAMGK